MGFGPGRRRELLDVGDLGRRQTREQIFQVVERIEVVPPTTAQQCVKDRAAFSGAGMANEQPILLVMASSP